jgi:hypothetical protein
MAPPLSQPHPPHHQPHAVAPGTPGHPLVAKPARSTALYDLMWVVFGMDCFAAGILAYMALILLLAVRDVRASLTCLALGVLLFAAAAIPRWFPQWLTRAGIPNPLALNPR